MQVVLYAKEVKNNNVEYLQTLVDVLHDNSINIFIYQGIKDQMDQVLNYKTSVGIFRDYVDFSIHKIDFFITLGGDGTILSAATIIRDSQIPVLGINLGRLGFLATQEKKLIKEAIGMIVNGRYEKDARTLLSLESDVPLFGDFPNALNDFTILKRDTSSMITIHTYINGDYLNTYWADGIIVATPTGSTGYSLSCGGPIIFPSAANFVITPVAPHNLNVRPIVIPDDSILSFTIEGRTDNFLCTLDSRFEMITASQNIAIRKCPYQINLLRLADKDFMQTLRDKLAWGKDARN